MGIIKELEKRIGESIDGFRPQSSGWYIITRTNQPESSRFQVACKETLEGYKIFLHDFKGINDTIKFDYASDKKPFKKTIKSTAKLNKVDLIHKEVIKLYKSSNKKDNGYLKGKGLWKFSPDKFKTKVVEYDNSRNLLMVFYTTFDLYPKPVGAKLINSKGGKFSVKGSTMSGAFHPHKYSESNTMYILGEGYAECCVASNLIDNANVLEYGSCNNAIHIINQLDKEANIYVMGENDSKEFYDELAKKYTNIKVTYPPDKDCKDFGDYFQKQKDFNSVREAILGGTIGQEGQNYKPLGMFDINPMVYSKVLNNVVKLNLNNLDDVLRVCFKAEDIHDIKVADKRFFANRVFLECAKSGSYSEDRNKPIGLWKKDENEFYYNDGTNVFKVGKEKLELNSYDSVIDNNFLLCKIPSYGTLNFGKEFTKINELIKLMEGCDWEHDCYGSLLLGFLTQSFFAGSHSFRPHMWIRSDSTHAGKSWLGEWVSKNLIKIYFARESGKSTSSGAIQGMKNLAGFLFCDEFAEKDTAYAKSAKEMIEALRSASTSFAPVVMGSPEQVHKKLLVRFSALMACIEGEEFLKQQDFDRIIFVNLTKKKGGFEEKLLPKFKEFAKNGDGEGFAAHCLKGYYLFDEWYDKLHIYFTKKYPEIGHKARGLASCIAGFGVLTRSSEKMKQLCKAIEKTSVIEPFVVKEDREDYLDSILRTLIKGSLIGHMYSDSSLRQALKDVDSIDAFGLRIERGMLVIYATMFKNFIEKYLKTTPHFVYKRLRKSKYFSKESNTTFNGVKTRTLYFKLPDTNEE